jgi:hypothetical protein
MPTDTTNTRTAAQVLADLRRNKKTIDGIEEKRTDAYQRRAELFAEGRTLDAGKVTQRELAEAAGVSETIVISAVKKVTAGA